MHTRALRRKHFPPNAAIRRPRLLAWQVSMGLSLEVAGQRLGLTPEEVQEATAGGDFDIALANIASLVAQGVEGMNTDLVIGAHGMLEQLVYACEPRVLLYLCHCHAEGKNGLALIVEAAERAMRQLREAAAAAEAPPDPEPPPEAARRPRGPVSRVDANMRRINLDLRDRLLAVYAGIVEARAAEAVTKPPSPAAKRRAAGYQSAKDLLLAALDEYVARKKVQPDTS